MIFDGACVSGYRALVCGYAFRKGGKTPNAHAPTWASIRAVHVTLSLSFVTHTHTHRPYIHTRTYARTLAQRIRVCKRTRVRTFAHVYLGARKHFAFVMLMEARFDG